MLNNNLCVAAAGLFLSDYDLFVNALFQLCNMGDDTHKMVAFRKTRQRIVSLVQGFRVQRTETFVYEQSNLIIPNYIYTYIRSQVKAGS